MACALSLLQARYVPGSVERLTETLDWLGIHFDEGPRAGGRCAPYFQVLHWKLLLGSYMYLNVLPFQHNNYYDTRHVHIRLNKLVERGT